MKNYTPGKLYSVLKNMILKKDTLEKYTRENNILLKKYIIEKITNLNESQFGYSAFGLKEKYHSGLIDNLKKSIFNV